MLEMGESLSIVNIVTKALLKQQKSNYKYTNALFKNSFYKNNTNSYTSMEDLISHFTFWHTGFRVKKNLTMSYIEAPKGEFGVALVSDNSSKPQKCKIRAPSYFNLQALSKFAKGHYLADLAALIGTLDIVFGEIDR